MHARVSTRIAWLQLWILIVVAGEAAAKDSEDGNIAIAPTDIARANAQGIASLRSMVMEGRLDMEIDGSAHVPRHRLREFTWVWQDDEVKVTARTAATPRGNDQAAKPQGNRDKWAYRQFYNGLREYRELINYDPNHPPSINETNGGGAAGIINTSFAKTSWGIEYPGMLLFVFGGPPDDVLSLSEMIADRANSCNIRQRPSQSNGYCYVLDVTATKAKKRRVFWVDAKANHLVKKVECYTESGELLSRSEVMAFHEAEGGVFVPRSVNSEVYQHSSGAQADQKVRIATYFEASIKQVNRELGPDALKVTFPEWLRVSDFRTGEVLLWGDNGPHRVFKTREDYVKFERETNPLAKQPPQRTRFGSGAQLAVAALIVLLIVWYFTQREKRLRASRSTDAPSGD